MYTKSFETPRTKTIITSARRKAMLPSNIIDTISFTSTEEYFSVTQSKNNYF